MRLFFDTETTDYWEFKQPAKSDAQPMPVQIAAVLEDDKGRTVAALSAILAQDRWPHPSDPSRLRPRVMVTERCTEVHGITNEMVDKFGQPPDLVIAQFRRMVEASDQQVAHNIEFDVGVFARTTWAMHIPPIVFGGQFCTMKQSSDIVGATNYMGGRKWPKLGEAYGYFQKKPLNNAHDALVDVYGCRAVYRGLIKHPDFVARQASSA